MTTNRQPQFCDDDGTPINPDLIPKPGLCVSCRKDSRAHEDPLCILTRYDQHGCDGFRCDAYEPKGTDPDGFDRSYG